MQTQFNFNLFIIQIVIILMLLCIVIWFLRLNRTTTLEKRYIGLLLNDVKQISAYYFLYEDCCFQDEEMFEIYKTVLFTDGEQFAPEIAKKDFNFARNPEKLTDLKYQLQVDYEDSKFTMEKTYTELKKLFALRKSCKNNPVRHTQEKIAEIMLTIIIKTIIV